ncbi:MAG: hypothetical protein K8T89_16400, partial [Planctomycetes bacterium]|nr:hypothetical protein [Planctomycetota bacterium]
KKAESKLKEIGEKLSDFKKRFDKIGEPTGEKKEELDKKFKPMMQAVTKKLEGQMNRIATQIDGGPDILKEITSHLAPLAKK